MVGIAIKKALYLAHLAQKILEQYRVKYGVYDPVHRRSCIFIFIHILLLPDNSNAYNFNTYIYFYWYIRTNDSIRFSYIVFLGTTIDSINQGSSLFTQTRTNAITLIRIDVSHISGGYAMKYNKIRSERLVDKLVGSTLHGRVGV
jgi:hypothetical protein